LCPTATFATDSNDAVLPIYVFQIQRNNFSGTQSQTGQQRQKCEVPTAVFATLAVGLVAGGMASVLFITAQLTADANLLANGGVGAYAQRSIPFALGVGFVAGLTADAVFGKLMGLEVVRTSGIDAAARGGR